MSATNEQSSSENQNVSVFKLSPAEDEDTLVHQAIEPTDVTVLPPTEDLYQGVGTTIEPGTQKRWLKPVAALVGVVAIGLGAYTASGQSDGGKQEVNNTPSVEAPDNENPADNPVEKNIGIGNVSLGMLEPGTNFVTATRLNGEEIRVPHLDNSNPEKFANTALALWACHHTTGSQECLDALSPDKDVQALLVDGREQFIVPRLEVNEFGKNGQVIIYDTPEDPAEFQGYIAENGLEVVELAGGNLFYRFFLDVGTVADNEWQTDKFLQLPGKPSRFTELKFIIGELEDGSPTVAGLSFNLEEA